MIEPRTWRRLLVYDRALTPVLIFSVLYLALVVGARGTIGRLSIPAMQWLGLASVVTASAVLMTFYDRRFLDLGLFISAAHAAKDLFIGFAWSAGIVIISDALIQLSGRIRRQYAGTLDGTEILTLFVPAVLHEELLFRGYPFQKLLQSSRSFAVVFGSGVFAVAHLGNPAVSTLGLLNVFLAGVLLALAFLWRSSLWLPIGLHFGWNFVSGPLLGHEVRDMCPPGCFSPLLIPARRCSLEGNSESRGVSGSR